VHLRALADAISAAVAGAARVGVSHAPAQTIFNAQWPLANPQLVKEVALPPVVASVRVSPGIGPRVAVLELSAGERGRVGRNRSQVGERGEVKHWHKHHFESCEWSLVQLCSHFTN
jgi:hypothetical protein